MMIPSPTKRKSEKNFNTLLTFKTHFKVYSDAYKFSHISACWILKYALTSANTFKKWSKIKLFTVTGTKNFLIVSYEKTH